MSERDISHLRADVDCLKQKNDYFVFFGFHIFLPPRLGGVGKICPSRTRVFFSKILISSEMEISSNFHSSQD